MRFYLGLPIAKMEAGDKTDPFEEMQQNLTKILSGQTDRITEVTRRQDRAISNIAD